MKNIFIAGVFFLAAYKQTGAQFLKVGDKCPPLILNHVINYTDSVIDLSAWKGKAVILDFWNTGCLGCIESFPSVDSMQRLFNGRLQFVLVTVDSKKKVENFFATRKKIKQPAVPFITDDTLLSSIFPHEEFPFHVWIEPDGIIRYITANRNATAANIASFLEKRALRFSDVSIVKGPDGLMKIDSNTRVEFYSYLAHSNVNNYLHAVTGVSSNNRYNVRLSAYQASIADLYKMAWEEAMGDHARYHFRLPSLIIWEITDTAGWIRPKNFSAPADWDEKYAYDYDLALLYSRKNDLYKTMQQDLTRYFKITGVVEKRELDCMILIKKEGKDKLETKGGEPVDSLLMSGSKKIITDSLRIIRNKPFKTLSTHLTNWFEYHLSLSLLDETGYTGNIDISFPGEHIDNFNLADIRKDLQQYGLDIIPAKRPIDVLVIRKSN